MITMMSRFISTCFLRPLICREYGEVKTYVAGEVACFLTTDCTERTSDDVFLNRHLTPCWNRERFLVVEWYLLMLTCKKEKKNVGRQQRGMVAFLLFYVVLCLNEYV